MLNGRQHVGVSVTIATSLEDACAALTAEPGSLVLAGGTDLMVEVNRGSRRIGNVVALNRIPELAGWHLIGDELRLGAGVTFAEICDPEIAALVPALAQAARTVGSPQIRNAATIGGNIATNAGGINVIRHGMTREWVVGLKVVTGAGDILDFNHGLIKNNTGYDFRHLFIGSEGTLGVICEATIQLTKPPEESVVLMLGWITSMQS